jgi:hypothetical protein
LFIVGFGAFFPEIVLLVAVVELFFAGYCFASPPSKNLFLLLTLLFVAFASLGLYKISIGESTCGCFGRITLSVYLIFIVDAFVLTILALCFWRTAYVGSKMKRTCHKHAIALSAGYLLCNLLFQWLMSRGLPVAFERLGASPIVALSVATYNPHQSPGWVECKLPIHNRSKNELTLYGATKVCGFSTSMDFPVVLQPGEVQIVAIESKIAKPGATLLVDFFLYSNGEKIRLKTKLIENDDYPIPWGAL